MALTPESLLGGAGSIVSGLLGGDPFGFGAAQDVYAETRQADLAHASNPVDAGSETYTITLVKNRL